MQHGEAIVGHHGFGVVRSLLGEGCFSPNRPKTSVIERTLGKNVDLRGAVNASGLNFTDARRHGERHDDIMSRVALVEGRMVLPCLLTS